MLVSLKEVSKYVSLEGLSLNEIANGLTYAGVEVEETYSLARGTNLVIGEIISCEAHPDSDHLHVLQVNLGTKYGVNQIVCGAPNARKGLKVIVARPGAILPEIEIKPSTIRGVESNGMCCSLLELGVESKYLNEYQTKGIEELPNDAPIGEENVLGYLGLDDSVLNISILANRPDLYSVYNVAKELGAIFQRKVVIPSVSIKPDFETKLVVGSETEKCSQFASREVRGIVTKPSPKWLSDCLMALGTRSINNIVDIGNYVMFLTGQPLHMYDADKLSKAELIAKDNYEGSFVALDEKTYELINGDIVISTNNKPMCLGGVMGNFECTVDENTKNIYIESASFNGASIRRTSNRLGLSSESSQRFVKGTNHFQANVVLDLATKLLCDLADAKDVSNIVNFTNEKYIEKVIYSSLKKINNRLGTSFDFDTIKNVFDRLNFATVGDADKFGVTIPSYRLDMTCDADLSEEIIRILGYSNVVSELPVLDTTIGALSLTQKRLRELRNYLLSIGIDECLTYTLISKKESELFNLLNNDDHYVLMNPLTDDREVVRTHITHSLLKVAGYNVSRQEKNIALFETANMNSKKSVQTHLSIVLVGNVLGQGLMIQRPYDFYDMKGIVENIFNLLGIEKSRYKIDKLSLKGTELHPGKSADIIFQGQVVGRFGELYPTQFSNYDLGKTSCVVLEMNIDSLLNAKVSVVKMSEISKFPIISRDLALVVNKEIQAADIIKTIKMIGKGIVNDVEVFDVYEGENIQAGKKSIAIKIIFGSFDHTLNDKEVGNVEDEIKFELSKSFNAELRA